MKKWTRLWSIILVCTLVLSACATTGAGNTESESKTESVSSELPLDSGEPGSSEIETSGTSETETPEPSETETPGSSETEIPEPSESETPEPSESEKPKPSESEKPKPSESETPEPSESEKPKPSESEKPKPSESEKPKPSESEKPKPSESETPEPSESEKPSEPKIAFRVDEIQVEEWNYNAFRYLVENYSDKIVWEVADTSIAQVVDSFVFGVYPGKTTLTGTLGNQTISVKINVTEGVYSAVDLHTDKITLFEGEAYRVLATRRDAKYTSADPSIATVASDGTVTGHKAGKTTITVSSSNGTTAQCTVKVVKDDGTYYKSKLNNTYNLATTRTMYITDRVVLCVDAGTPLEDNFMKKIEDVLDAIERYSGLSYTDVSTIPTPTSGLKQIQINVVSNGSAYGGNFGVCVQPYDLAFEQNGVWVIAHELLHTIQLRNSVAIGNMLTEGWTVYGCEQIQNMFSYSYKEDMGYSETSWLEGAGITADNIEENMLSGQYIYEGGYLFVRYLIKNYGMAKMREIMDGISAKAVEKDGFAPAGTIGLTEEEIYEAIKACTSQDILQKFYSYAKSCNNKVVTSKSDWRGYGTYYMTFAGHCRDNYWGVEDNVICDGSIVIDLTKAIDYAEKAYGRKYKGMIDQKVFHYEIDGITVTYYDENDNVIEPEEKEFGNFGDLTYVKGAVKAKYEGATEFDFLMDIRFQFDDEFTEQFGW